MTDNIALRVLETAEGLVGTPFALPLNPRRKLYPKDGLSCFALVCYAFEAAGVMLPQGLIRARDLLAKEVGLSVCTIEGMMPTDVILMRNPNSRIYDGLPTHCGLYHGNGEIIHSSYVVGLVAVQPLDEVMMRYAFMGARRII